MRKIVNKHHVPIGRLRMQQAKTQIYHGNQAGNIINWGCVAYAASWHSLRLTVFGSWSRGHSTQLTCPHHSFSAEQMMSRDRIVIRLQGEGELPCKLIERTHCWTLGSPGQFLWRAAQLHNKQRKGRENQLYWIWGNLWIWLFCLWARFKDKMMHRMVQIIITSNPSPPALLTMLSRGRQKCPTNHRLND